MLGNVRSLFKQIESQKSPGARRARSDAPCRLAALLGWLKNTDERGELQLPVFAFILKYQASKMTFFRPQSIISESFGA